MIFTAPPDREARLESRELPASMTRIASRGDGGGLDGILGRISAALDKVDRRQIAVLTDMEERMDGKARRMRSVLSDLGVDPAKTPRRRHRRAVRPVEAAALGRQRLRPPALPHQCRARRDQPIFPYVGLPCRCANRSPAKSI